MHASTIEEHQRLMHAAKDLVSTWEGTPPMTSVEQVRASRTWDSSRLTERDYCAVRRTGDLLVACARIAQTRGETFPAVGGAGRRRRNRRLRIARAMVRAAGLGGWGHRCPMHVVFAMEALARASASS